MKVTDLPVGDRVQLHRVEILILDQLTRGLLLLMQEGTNLFARAVVVVAVDFLEIRDVVLEFLPAMTVLAVQSVRTAVFVPQNFLFAIPKGTHHRFLVVEKGTLEVLPVVSEDTGEPIVIDF